MFNANPNEPNTLRTNIYHPPYNEQTVSSLASNFPNVNPKLFHLPSCEINEGLHMSPIQLINDVYNHYDGESWQTFINASPKMCNLESQDVIAYHAMQEYQNQFKSAAFDSFSSYWKSKPVKFKGNANKIVAEQTAIYRHLATKLFNIPCYQISVRYPLQPTIANNSATDELKVDDLDSSDDEDDDDLYGTQLKEWGANEKMQKERRQKPQPQPKKMETASLSDFNHDISEIMRQFVQHTNTVYQCQEMQVNGDKVSIYEKDTSGVAMKCIIKHKQTLSVLLNSVQDTIANCLTFLYIVYQQCIIVYAYVTTSELISFGSRIFEKGLLHITESIPFIFEANEIDSRLRYEINKLPLKSDGNWVRYKKLFVNTQDFNGFHTAIGECVKRWNDVYNDRYGINLEDIKNIFKQHNIDTTYFVNGINRMKFRKLMQQRRYPSIVVDTLWIQLGGAKKIKIDSDQTVNRILEDDDDDDIDIDLDELAVDILDSNLLCIHSNNN